MGLAKQRTERSEQALEGLLWQNDVQVRKQAGNALEYGQMIVSERALSRLQWLAEHEADPELRKFFQKLPSRLKKSD